MVLCVDEDDDEVTQIDESALLWQSAFPLFDEIRRQGKLCDVTLIAENQRFTAHRLLLAATVPYFRIMFTSDMAEAQLNEITMQDFDADSLEQLINFAYTGRIRISAGNVQAILFGANFLQLVHVVEKCCVFLEKRLQGSNVLGIRAFSLALGCKSLVRSCDRFVQKHFLAVARSEEFLALPIDELVALLNRDELFVESEQQVFEAGARWLRVDPSRARHAARMLACVRLPLLKPQFLSDQVASDPLIRACLDCRDLVDSAKDYHLIPERRHSIQPFKTKGRCCQDVPGLIFAVGGLSSAGDSQSTVEMFDPLLGRWTLMQPMSSLRSRVGVAVMQRQLYAIGGFNGHDRLRTVEVLDPETRQWKEVAPLNCKRSALGAAVLNDRLYVCGGYDGITSLSSVELFSPDTGRWTNLPGMSKQRSAAGIAVLDNCVYVLGGHDGMSIFNSVECFDVDTEQWSCNIPPMKHRRCRLGAAAIHGRLYVAGGYDGSQFLRSVECFDPAVKEWKELAPMQFKRSRVSLVANCGKLYAIAGYDGASNLATMEVYDVDEDRWEMSASLTAHEGGVGIGVIPLAPPPT